MIRSELPIVTAPETVQPLDKPTRSLKAKKRPQYAFDSDSELEAFINIDDESDDQDFNGRKRNVISSSTKRKRIDSDDDEYVPE